jgi:hypothetical protein
LRDLRPHRQRAREREGTVESIPSLTLSRALLRLSGVDYYNLGSVLTQDASRALRPFLESHGFDLGQPIHVRELPEGRGFQLTQ